MGSRSTPDILEAALAERYRLEALLRSYPEFRQLEAVLRVLEEYPRATEVPDRFTPIVNLDAPESPLPTAPTRNPDLSKPVAPSRPTTALDPKVNPRRRGWTPSEHLAYGEMRHRCLDQLRSGEAITAEAVVVKMMGEKGLDPEGNRQLRSDFLKRTLRALDALRRIGQVEKIGYGHHVQWRLPVAESTN